MNLDRSRTASSRWPELFDGVDETTRRGVDEVMASLGLAGWRWAKTDVADLVAHWPGSARRQQARSAGSGWQVRARRLADLVAEQPRQPLRGSWDHVSRIHRHLDDGHDGRVRLAGGRQTALMDALATAMRTDWDHLDRPHFVEAIAAVAEQLVQARAFPETRGATEREFMRQLAATSPWRLDYTRLTRSQWDHASTRPRAGESARQGWAPLIAAATVPAEHHRDGGETADRESSPTTSTQRQQDRDRGEVVGRGQQVEAGQSAPRQIVDEDIPDRQGRDAAAGQPRTDGRSDRTPTRGGRDSGEARRAAVVAAVGAGAAVAVADQGRVAQIRHRRVEQERRRRVEAITRDAQQRTVQLAAGQGLSRRRVR